MRKFIALCLYILADIMWPHDQRARQVIIIDEPPITEDDTQPADATEPLAGWDVQRQVYRSDWRQ